MLSALGRLVLSDASICMSACAFPAITGLPQALQYATELVMAHISGRSLPRAPSGYVMLIGHPVGLAHCSGSEALRISHQHQCAIASPPRMLASVFYLLHAIGLQPAS